MIEQSILDLLVSEKNISGVWVVVGALLTLFGVFANNLFESGRKRKEREHTLIRDVYFGGTEYINHYFNMIVGTNRWGKDSQFKVDPSVTEKYYKIFMVGSPQVINAFAELNKQHTTILLRLASSNLAILELEGDLDIAQANVKHGLEMMGEANNNLKQNNEKKIFSQELLGLYRSHYSEGQRTYEEASKRSDLLNNKLVRKRMELLKACLDAIIDISPIMYHAIISMRKDLDRSLSGKEKSEIQRSIDSMLEQLQASAQKFIDETNKRIDEMSDTDTSLVN